MFILKLDIDRVIDDCDGIVSFLKALDKASRTSRGLVQILAQYTQFNSIFGSGVANLAGEIAARPDIFKERNEPIRLIADRSCDVAAAVFFAAIEEFAPRKNHRRMAQELLRETLIFFELTQEAGATGSKSLLEIRSCTQKAIQAVAHGYCLNRTVADADLFRGVGFHIGSELLADLEFNILHNFLLNNRGGELVSYLKEKKAYTWVAVHTTVETEHFEAAVESAELALKYYTGEQSEAYMWILEGVKEFASIQSGFMNDILLDALHTESAEMAIEGVDNSLSKPTQCFSP